MTSTIVLVQTTVLSATQAELENVLLVDFLSLESQTRMTAGLLKNDPKNETVQINDINFYLQLIFHHFSPFNSCLSVVL